MKIKINQNQFKLTTMNKKRRLLLMFFVFFASSTILLAQTKKTVTGIVKDTRGDVLIGATISEKGVNTNSVISDQNGSFTIKIGENSTLAISYIGYSTKEITATEGQMSIIMDAEGGKTLNEVVVTGFGQKKQLRKVTYATQEVKGADLVRANSPNLINALQGKMAGVAINQGSGGPTSASRIRIRGNASLSPNTQPLFVIDGVLFRPGTTGANSWGSAQDFGNEINGLNADDYESVTVLKGTAASALYGSDALNGVVVITTKKGLARKGLGVTFSQTNSFDTAYKSVDVQNEFGGGLSPTFKVGADGKNELDPANFFWNYGPKFDGSDVRDVDGRIIKWKPNDLLSIYQTGLNSTTNVAIDGGNEKSSFRFSYTNNTSNSIIPNNKQIKNTFFLRATHKLSSKISVDANVNYALTKGLNPIRQGGNSNPLFALVYFNPRHLDIDYWKNHYTDPAGGQLNADDDWYSTADPFFSINNDNAEQTTENLRAGLDINSALTPWLNLLVRGNINSTVNNGTTENFGRDPGFTGGYYSLSQSNAKNVRFQTLLTGNRQLTDNLNLNLTLGGETNRDLGGRNSFLETRGGLAIPNKFYLGNSKDPIFGRAGVNGKKRLDAVYAYGDISYKDMLTLNFSARQEFDSRLTYPHASNGETNYSFFYPSAGLSFVFTELTKENTKLDFLSFGKLRASYGHTGGSGADIYETTARGNYQAQGAYQGVNGTVSPVYGFQGNSLGNLHLKNLLAKEFELGADVRFFNNRIGLDFTFYKKNTYNQILPISAPVESGVSSRVINAGNIENKGIEIVLSTVPFRTKDFEWTSNFNFSQNKNKIIDLAPGVLSYDLDLAFGNDVQSVAPVGGEYGTIQTSYAFATYQKLDASGNPIDHPSNGKRLVNSANSAFLRTGNVGQGTKKLGTMMEKFLLSNINSMRYKDFTFGFQIDSKVGGLMASATHQYGSTNGSLKSTLPGRDAAHGGVTFTAANGVTRDDGIIPDGVFPDGTTLKGVDAGGMTYADAVQQNLILPIDARRYYARLTQWSTGIREYSVFENSWVAVREVSVGYSIPKKFVEKAKLDNLRLNLVGRNLFYIYNSAPDNINPEGLFSNRAGTFAEYGGLPFVRTVSFSVNASF